MSQGIPAFVGEALDGYLRTSTDVHNRKSSHFDSIFREGDTAPAHGGYRVTYLSVTILYCLSQYSDGFRVANGFMIYTPCRYNVKQCQPSIVCYTICCHLFRSPWYDVLGEHFDTLVRHRQEWNAWRDLKNMAPMALPFDYHEKLKPLQRYMLSTVLNPVRLRAVLLHVPNNISH